MSSVHGSAETRRAEIRTLFVLVGLLWVVVSCASPVTSPAPSAGTGGDPRSSGQGPGLVGDPLFAIGAVVALGLGAAIVTVAYVRMTTRPER